jgi:L-cystine uptake protein TcyP (sodium:dicarboxylate symporter family)
MNEDEYILSRLDDQIEWYSLKSNYAKFMHQIFRVFVIIFSSVIPLVAGIDFNQNIKNITLSTIGFLITVLVGLSSLFKFQENWTEYRTTSETLKHEKMLFLTKSGPYNSEESFKTLVLRTENLISRENSAWSQYVIK